MNRRYEINSGPGAEWDEAEQQIQRTKGVKGRGTTVSVKSARGADGESKGKRKAGALDEAYKELESGEGRKGKKGKKGR